jgi:RimJ/RimL family protein N-acetyltransferase
MTLHITTHRLILRPFELRDLEPFVAYRADPRVAQYQGWSSFTAAQGQEFLEWAQTARLGVPGEWYQVAIERAGGRVGDCAVHTLDAERVELGVTLALASWGQGIATEALIALIAFLRERGFIHFTATTDVRNEPVHRLFERLGFDRDHLTHGVYDGESCDEWVYVLDAA